MADIWMDVDVALSEVPVNITPLVLASDPKTRKENMAYNAAGLELIWHFTTTAGATSATVVTPTSGGDYDWAHQDGGMYTIAIPASGGASINNNAEGFGWFTGVATGVLPWRGPIIGFRAAGLNNLLVDSAYSATRGLAGTALPNAAADAAGGLPISDAGGLDLDAQVKTAVNAIKAKTDNLPANTSTVLGTPAGDSISADVAAIKAETATIVADTNELQTDWHDGGRLDLMLDAATAPSAAAVADAVWDEALAGHTAVGSAGAGLSAAGSAGDPWSTPLPGAYGEGTAGKIVGDNLNAPVATVDTVVDGLATTLGVAGAGLTAVPWNAAWDAEVQSECTDALNAYDPPTKAEVDASIAAGDDAVLAVLGSPAGASMSADIAAVKSETAAIVADTNELQTDWHDGGRLDLLLDDAGGAGTPPTVEEIRAELEEAGSHLALIKAKTDSLTFTVAGDVDCNVQTWKGSAAADMTGDAYARLGAPTGASVSADLADIEGKVDDLEGRVIGTIAAGTHNPQSGDAYARLGAPVGASVSADIANIPTAVENADALLKRDWTYVAGAAARSVLNALRLLRNKVDTTTTPGTLTVCEEDDSTPAWTAAITTDAAAEPITEIDPA